MKPAEDLDAEAPEEVDAFQDYLWGVLGVEDRRRLVEFDDRPDRGLDLPNQVQLMAFIHAINDLCAELQESLNGGFDVALERLRNDGGFPPDIPIFSECPAVVVAVASLASCGLFPGVCTMDSRRTTAGRLIEELGTS